MRKKHQAILISSTAKKGFCNEISLGNFTYESEIKEQLSQFFNKNIKQEDVEHQDDNDGNLSDDDSFEVSSIKVPKQISNNTKEYAKFYISEKAILSGIDPFNYETIPQKTININYNNSEHPENNNNDLGDSIKFFDIIKQYIYWKEKSEVKDKKKEEIDCFQLFNLDANKIKNIKEKLIELRKIIKEKKLDAGDSIINKFLTDLENHYTNQKKEINNLISNLEYIDTISYGKKWSQVDFHKAKTIKSDEMF